MKNSYISVKCHISFAAVTFNERHWKAPFSLYFPSRTRHNGRPDEANRNSILNHAAVVRWTSRSTLWAKNVQWCHREAGVSEKRCDLGTGHGGGREEGDEQWEQWGGKRGGWDGDERGLRASAATAVMAQTRWRGEQWSEARGEAVVTLLQRHMSWQLVTTQPIRQRQTQTHSHYPTHQIGPASTAPTRYQHKCDKHIRINQHSLSTPSAIIRPKIISYTFSKTLVTAIFIIIFIILTSFSYNHWSFQNYPRV